VRNKCDYGRTTANDIVRSCRPLQYHRQGRWSFIHLTSEIEMKGSESFIESNFDKIQDLLAESFGAKKEMLSREAKTRPNQEPISSAIMKESQMGAEIARRESFDALPTLPVTTPVIPEISQEMKVNRPPLRKYIRYVGAPGHQKISIQVIEEKPSVISINSLKDKFGLSESKIEGIIRDAEKLGKVRRVMNGSYVWAQD